MTTETPNLTEYSVSEIASAVKRTVEDRFGLVRVRGEISGWKQAGSGHAYLCLKDESAVLDGVMWRGMVNGLRFRPEDGLEVIATGKLTTYPGRSKYQMVIERMEPAGVGALMALLEERKRKLAAEGLFDPRRKRPIPYLPQVIGVVTSPTGAVIRDILHRLADRFPRHVLLWPVLVQGEGAAEQVANAVRGFNSMAKGGDVPRPDVLIVARGGGSIEDLWAFNEEVVIRAVAESDIPVISAVGHETDTTLVDYASDRRAPTPTAAAEMAVPVKADLDYTIGQFGLRLERALHKGMERRSETIKGLARGLPHPRHLLQLAEQRFDELSERLPKSLNHGLVAWRNRYERLGDRLAPRLLTQELRRSFERVERVSEGLTRVTSLRLRDEQRRLGEAVRMLETLSPYATVQRGYAVVRSRDGRVLTTAEAAQRAGSLTLELRDGTVGVVVEGEAQAVPAAGAPVAHVREIPAAPPKAKASRAKPAAKEGGEPVPAKDRQGSLF